ncbi:hydantoinase/oxoprolinase family protein [Sulfitobacter mediterraneus]|uniref:hydantoinase/oxoprolinase N-terminal domain-containing protein n=1 Tax=Sulfitobacter mediterraneus TaxID=83219 RepID=UPI0019327AC6|nr:hydantoinase/oxoprolinase family protein [Sulfitobacter mediterraneus]MBM1633055.1 hydantoinase/oxoprolinase family protein [Sulfitobacter mediterraneus]MBM1640811.1 hydantoinase/oxoprolinase family protein [Sulfitobacter mediterraneus]MBM1644920.1 hydantoinase/oxoprolinase family protein [Sulfitobacter mediterraneus]MBM1648931.1 hydantoinase/oxoprolinase family protein [Sulfitobacter mediterraneus]MBM1652952.1 hydantoinase/oxoprolinase family protein [Sulfitobacter mediterraneus]
MAVLLGVDTGGTYTDAVLVRDETTVIASAKSLTTRQDLAIGVGNAVRSVLETAQIAPEEIALASLSTTLATNALVEGQGGRVALIYIGFRARDLEAHGLAEALKGDPALVLSGGHNHAGGEAQPLDEAALVSFLETHKSDVSGFAVASQFATRNPAHELRAAQLVAEITGKPVSSSHQLSAKLNGPKRAMTAVLNARLIGMIDRLIGRAEDVLQQIGTTAPLMVVRGDGALISSGQARERPIETILSGPAASIVGARWMTGVDHALVSDIGGTTTDVALIKGGKPQIDPAGARVGPYRTMVEAVAMRTTGLGGDSEVHFQSEGLQGGVTLGPRRVLPISLIAVDAPDVVHAALDSQLRSVAPGEHDARFVRAVAGQTKEGLGTRELALLERIGNQVHPLGDIIRSRVELGALKRLVERGQIQIAGVTPSDASHVLGRVMEWDTGAARKALRLFGRRRTGAGDVLSNSEDDIAQMIIDQLTHQTALALLETAFAEEDPGFDVAPDILARHVLMQRGMSGHQGLVRLNTGLAVDVVGLGASAPSYYPAVGERLGTRMILPEHAGVANAIGAVVGRVTMRQSGTVTSPSEGKYRVHLADGPKDFGDQDSALALLETVLRDAAQAQALEAGAQDIQITVSRDIRTAGVEAREVFVEATVTVEAAGRPRVAEG